MRMFRNSPRLLAGALILPLGIAQPALAEVFCVATAVGLQDALSTASSNAQDNEVRIVQGIYVGNFVYDSNQVAANKLAVLGGYTADCTGRTIDPANTILDGNLNGKVLRFKVQWFLDGTGDAECLVEGLTLRKGDGGIGGGLDAQVREGGAVRVNRNRFENNKAIRGGGALIDATTVTLTNNILAGNTADDDGGGAIIYATTATLTNNSITGNTAEVYGGLSLWLRATETTDAAQLYNNLFWDNVSNDNQGADLWIDNDDDGDFLPTPVTLLANNFDQSPTGFSSRLPITIDPTNLNQIDPLFVAAGAGDFHLQPGSPMIDAGYPGTPDLPEFDIAGTPRVLGDSVDIGAYEYDDGGFYDVDPTSWAYDYINAIRDAGITGGCGNGNYCPQGLVTREQMAAFLVRAVEGEPAANYCAGGSYFSDVSPDAWSCSYIQRLAELNITGGCGGGNYCPQGLVTRDQMAAFIVRAVEGEPPLDYCGGVAPFQDVAPSGFFCRYIKRLAELNVTQGCGSGNYCPYDALNREQMAALLARAFLNMD